MARQSQPDPEQVVLENGANHFDQIEIVASEDLGDTVDFVAKSLSLAPIPISRVDTTDNEAEETDLDNGEETVGKKSTLHKACRHISCISLGKLTTKLQNLQLVRADCRDRTFWLCLSCLHLCLSQTGQKLATAHGRAQNHPLFLQLDFDHEVQLRQDNFPTFYCAQCASTINLPSQPEQKMEKSLGKKAQVILEKVASLVLERIAEVDCLVMSLSKAASNEHGPNTNATENLRNAPIGLVNLGNTCFMNSALQALTALMDSIALIKSEEYMKAIGDGPLANSLIQLIASLGDSFNTGSEVSNAKTSTLGRTRSLPIIGRKGNQSLSAKFMSSNGVVNPSEFLSRLCQRHKEFRKMRQQDAHDFLRLLFNTMDDEKCTLHKKLFGGILVSKVCCSVCSNTSITREDFLDISLALKGAKRPPSIEQDLSYLNINSENEIDGGDEYGIDSASESGDELSLVDLLNFWSSPTRLVDDNAFACENCPKQAIQQQTNSNPSTLAKFMYQPAIQKFSIETLPIILSFHLQRFAMTGEAYGGKRNSVRLTKDHRQISVPLILDMARYVSHSARTVGTCFRYELVAMVVHEGATTESGHYVAVVRRSDRQWFLASDSLVKLIDPRHLTRYNPYLVFYHRISCLES